MGTELPVSHKFNYLEITAEEEKQKAIDDWLPITSSRNAKWYYSAFHNITAIVGAGVLGLPYAMSELGCYSTIGWMASFINKDVMKDVDYDYKQSESRLKAVFSFFQALGAVAFAYAGHNVVLEIQAAIPSTQERPAKGPMWRGVKVAYITVALCYFPIAIIGYWVFGNKVKPNILYSFEKPNWLIAMANLFVVIHLIGGYQVFAMPVFDMIETLLVRKLHFQPSRILRFFVRNLYVAFTMFMAITFPFFDGLLGFFGGFAFAPTTYFLPCIIWLKIYKPKRFSSSWWCNWSCIVFTVCLMLVAPIGGMWSIVNDAKYYKFYSGNDTQT